MLAKAAVDGDETARDLFEYKSQSQRGNRNKSKMDTKNLFMSSESLNFIVAGDKGSVFYVNESAKFFKLFQMDNAVTKILYNQEKSMLISITRNQMLGQYIIRSENEVSNRMTVKFEKKKFFNYLWSIWSPTA